MIRKALNSCCFFIPIHRAYILILYVDLIRFSFACVYIFVFFFSVSLKTSDYIFQTFVFLLNCMLAYQCMKVLNMVFMKINYKIHKIYLAIRIIFWIMNLIKFFLYTNKNCIVFGNNYEHCYLEEFKPIIYSEFFLIFLDIYLFFMIMGFYQNLKRGKYGVLNGNPIFPESLPLVFRDFYKHAVIIETYGYKVKNLINNAEIQTGSIKKMNNLHKKNPSTQYFKIFPLPLLRKKKRQSINKSELIGHVLLDLTSLMEKKPQN